MRIARLFLIRLLSNSAVLPWTNRDLYSSVCKIKIGQEMQICGHTISVQYINEKLNVYAWKTETKQCTALHLSFIFSAVSNSIVFNLSIRNNNIIVFPTMFSKSKSVEKWKFYNLSFNSEQQWRVKIMNLIRTNFTITNKHPSLVRHFLSYLKSKHFQNRQSSHWDVDLSNYVFKIKIGWEM